MSNYSGEQIRTRLASIKSAGIDELDVGRQRFLDTRGAQALASGKPLAKAAVLVPLVPRAGGLQVLLTQRSPHLRRHAGQVAFPGGMIDPGDESPEHAALREAREEIGLSADKVELLGRLDEYVTGTYFHVIPVVGLILLPLDLERDLMLNPQEVAGVFEVPLDFVLDPKNRRRESRTGADGETHEFNGIPYENRNIWGATAGMLINLSEILGTS